MLDGQKFVQSLGHLVIATSNNESLFQAIFDAMVGGEDDASPVIWHSSRTTQAKIDLTIRIARSRLKGDPLLTRLEDAAKRFKPHSRTRNFFCHAAYLLDQNGMPRSAQGVRLTQDDDPINRTDKIIGPATLNELNQALKGLGKLNADLWPLANEIANKFGATHTNTSLRLAEQIQGLDNPDRLKTGPSPEGPPESSPA